MLGAWGFSVDDALISGRVAHHLYAGHGYRFNPSGPVVDAVTPLGWAYLLAPFGTDPSSAVNAARWLGGFAWALAAAVLGSQLARHDCRSPLVLLVVAACLPLGAWSVAGMETGFVIALCALALLGNSLGAASAGLAAALRPELLPWAIALALGAGIVRRESLTSLLRLAGLSLLPFAIVVAIRSVVFGSPAPLAVFAKPSDFSHGLRYALGALLLSGPTYLLLSRHTFRDKRLLPILAATAVHWITLLGVGGDWMPLWRLWMPVVPGLIFAGAIVANHSRPVLTWARCGLALAVCAVIQVGLGASSRSVWEERQRWIAQARGLLSTSQRIATLDVGWVGAAFPGPIVDLSGVTDPRIAWLPGGHTSKQVPANLLVRQRVDTLVLLGYPSNSQQIGTNWVHDRYARSVESRLARAAQPLDFRVIGDVPIAGGQRYVILRRALPSELAAAP